MAKYSFIRIIIVDDEQTCRDIILSHIKSSGLFEEGNVFVFDDPFDVLEFLERDSADIIISDYNMPQMHGDVLIEAAKELRPNIRAILFSASIIPDFPEIKSDILNVSDLIIEKIPEEEILLEALSNFASLIGHV